jgi:hypothetical protein
MCQQREGVGGRSFERDPLLSQTSNMPRAPTDPPRGSLLLHSLPGLPGRERNPLYVTDITSGTQHLCQCLTTRMILHSGRS